MKRHHAAPPHRFLSILFVPLLGWYITVPQVGWAESQLTDLGAGANVASSFLGVGEQNRGEGESIGPDLTGVGRRYNAHDLLTEGEILDRMAYVRSGGEEDHPLVRPKATVPLAHAHAHNDYLHKRPLLDALQHGFCGIEADIHRVEDELLVGHDPWMLKPDRTLRNLYLDPLRERVKSNGGRVYADSHQTIMLLIDIKTDGAKTYDLLRQQLSEYTDLLEPPPTDPNQPPPVKVVVSGNRPRQAIEQDTSRRVGIDGRIGDLDTNAPANLIPLVSDHWPSYFSWRGKGPIPEAQRQKLRRFVEKAHAQGRQLRFWATPETDAVWQELHQAGVDWVGTDDLARLEQFLRTRKKNHLDSRPLDVR